MASKRIGDILVELGYLTGDRLGQLSHIDGDGLLFGERLCRMGLIREEDVLHALAIQCQIPHFHINGAEIPAEALDCLAADLAERYRVLPLAIVDDRLNRSSAHK